LRIGAAVKAGKGHREKFARVGARVAPHLLAFTVLRRLLERTLQPVFKPDAVGKRAGGTASRERVTSVTEFVQRDVRAAKTLVAELHPLRPVAIHAAHAQAGGAGIIGDLRHDANAKTLLRRIEKKLEIC